MGGELHGTEKKILGIPLSKLLIVKENCGRVDKEEGN
jgi:hypothetical protein